MFRGRTGSFNAPSSNEPSVHTDRVRILVCGDSNVGKSSFIHLLCNDEVLQNPSSTVGCHADVKVTFDSRN